MSSRLDMHPADLLPELDAVLATTTAPPQSDPHDHDGPDPNPAPRADARTRLTALAFAVQPSLALFINYRGEDSHSYGALL